MWSFGESWDCYAATADMLNNYWDSAAATTVSGMSLVAGRFAGSQAIRIVTASNATLIKTSGVNDSVHHFVLAFRQTAAISGTTLAAYLQLFDGVTAQCSVVFRSDGAMLLTSGGPAGTVLATYAGAVPVINTWYAFEIEVVVHNSTGSFKVRKNGNAVDDHSTTGIDTAGGTANNYANKLQIAQNTTLSGQEIDDLYWRSDASSVAWLGDVRCIARAPASDAAVQFSRTPGTVQAFFSTSSVAAGGPAANLIMFQTIIAPMSGPATAALASFASSITGHVNMALYDNSGPPGAGSLVNGSPAVLLAQGTPLTNPGTGLQTFTFGTPVNVIRGVQYWVAMLGDTTLGVINGATGTPRATLAFPYGAGAFPASAAGVGNVTATNGFGYLGFQMSPGNYSVVAEAQQDLTNSYVYDSVVGHQDLYGIAPIASTPLTTYAVTTRAYAIKSDAGTRTMAVQLKSGATTDASTTVVLTPSNWQWAWKHYPLDPATGAAWTAAAVNVAQVGPVVIA
jgi:hypothetical protein